MTVAGYKAHTKMNENHTAKNYITGTLHDNIIETLATRVNGVSVRPLAQTSIKTCQASTNHWSLARFGEYDFHLQNVSLTLF